MRLVSVEEEVRELRAERERLGSEGQREREEGERDKQQSLEKLGLTLCVW